MDTMVSSSDIQSMDTKERGRLHAEISIKALSRNFDMAISTWDNYPYEILLDQEQFDVCQGGQTP